MSVRCLVVDDSPQFLAAAQRLLEREGVAVVGVASTGEDAIRKVAELSPDVLLVDINLDGESGLDLAARLHGDPHRPPAPPVILISTHSKEDYAELISASPAIGFLAKDALSATAVLDLLAGTGKADESVDAG